jgi:ATP-dependent DNA helicase PIF1
MSDFEKQISLFASREEKKSEELASKGKRWDETEINQLFEELNNGLSVSQISNIHKRTDGAITSRIRELAFKMFEDKVEMSEIMDKTKLSEENIMKAVSEKREWLIKTEEKKKERAKERLEMKQVSKPSLLENKPLMKQKLSIEQQCALQQFEDDDNLFITGEGGTGKTLLIRHLVQSAKRNFKKIQVCALTGCAALLLGCNARTIHSWSGIKLGRGEINTIVDGVFQNHKARNAWKSTDILIVDEVSMMSKRIFEVLNTVGCRVRGSRLPFGGMQIVFVGDFFQLPPVSVGKEMNEDDKFCFESELWLKTFPIDNHIVLNTIFRQSDTVFRKILGNIRKGKIDNNDINTLNKYVNREFDIDSHNGVVPTKLFPTKNKVDAVNQKMFDELAGESKTFTFISKTNCVIMMDGSEKPVPGSELSRCKKLLNPQKTAYEVDSLANNSPCVKVLNLKRGANVMCTVNLDLSKGICNGSLGIVINFTSSPEGGICPLVRFSNGVETIIPMKFWQSEEFPSIAVGQYPLCLAWAMTIHKIQGATLTMAEIDIGSGIFECGQTYVALSRVKDLDGLYLSKFDPKKIKTSVCVRKFYDSIPEVEYEEEEEEPEENESESSGEGFNLDKYNAPV